MRPGRAHVGLVAGVVMAVAGTACGPLGASDAVTSSARSATTSGDAGGASIAPATASPTALPTSHETTPATPRPTASPMTPGTTPATPSPTGAATPAAPLQGLALEQVASGLVQPLDVVTRPGDGALFAVQQQGTVVRVTGDGTTAEQPLLDVSGNMEIHGIEQGLLGMAFHPRHPEDPRVFVFHSLPSNDNVLVSYEVSDDDAEQVDADSRTVLLTIDKEPDKVRHNGGTVLFGPDGMLWLSLGDAARASVNGQDPSTLPGSILRLDVDGGDPYAIPPDNPFADGATVDGVTGAPEVYWFGLRNPWRFSIDEPTGTAWIGNVGQETVEEVEVAAIDEGGINFGWPAFEGSEPFYDDPPVTESVDPVFEVRHDDSDEACSLTGGVVYRGATIPELDGHYFYADWCVGWIRSFALEDGEVVEQQDWSEQLDVGMVSSFGTDADGELLVVDWDAGAIFRVLPER